jgi:hypothetical protein
MPTMPDWRMRSRSVAASAAWKSVMGSGSSAQRSSPSVAMTTQGE